ncbi:MAG: hypothetical protein ABI165_11465, partial [Bryobacteraceae bacterium]
PVLRESGVQFVLAGHNHFYARMKPIGHVEHIISGGGGRHLSRPEPDGCTEAVRETFHFTAYEVLPDAVRMFAVGEDGKVFDEATIDRAYLDAAETGCAAAQ